jgi:recombination protein RecA
MLSTIADYANECARLGISIVGSGKNGKIMKMDYIHGLEHYYLNGYRQQGLLSPGLDWIANNIESPQLAQAQSAFRTEKQFETVVGRSNMLAEQKEDGCFGWNTPILLADGSTLPIGKIVDEKLPVEVLSYNVSKKIFEVKKVINWFNNGKKAPDEWRLVNLSRDAEGHPWAGTGNRVAYGGRVFATKTHHYFDGEGFTEVDKLKYVYGIIRTCNPFQEQLLLGTLLGDESVSWDKKINGIAPRMVIVHSIKQKDYLDKLVACLGWYVSKVNSGVSGYGAEIYGIYTKVIPFLEELVENNYQGHSKQVSIKWLNQLKPMALAIWYLDDGSRGEDDTDNQNFPFVEDGLGGTTQANLAINGFNEESAKIICEWFNNHGFYSSLSLEDRTITPGYTLCLNHEGADYFYQVIAPYIPISMAYKLPKKYRCIAGSIHWWEYNTCGFALAKEKLGENKMVYFTKHYSKSSSWRTA